MEILVKRIKKGPNSVLSQYYVNGHYRGYIVEDKDRGLTADMPLDELMATKVHSKTAIPFGRYRVTMRRSPSFKMFVPWLRNVPGFEYIYIHKGNWITDTMGCLLVGLNWGMENGEYCVRNSKDAFDPLIEEINEALGRREVVWVEIVAAYDQPPQPLV